jgi:hypothetical protein
VVDQSDEDELRRQQDDANDEDDQRNLARHLDLPPLSVRDDCRDSPWKGRTIDTDLSRSRGGPVVDQ